MYSETFALLIIFLVFFGLNTEKLIDLIKAGDDFPNVFFVQAKGIAALILDRPYVFFIIAVILGVISYFVTAAVADKRREVI